MQILFDYQAFELQRIGGVSRSYAELISHLQNENCRCIVGIMESDNIYLSEMKLVSGLKPTNYRHDMLFGGKKLFKGQRMLIRKALHWYGYENDCKQVNKDCSIKLLRNQQFDIFEPTFFDSYFLPYLKNKPFVMTVHDMIPELYPEYFSMEDFQIIQKRMLCPLAAHIHVPSQKTKEDLVNILDVSPDKITVIPHGRPDFIEDGYSAPPIFDFPYLLYVGDRFGYKNFSLFIKECSYIIQKFPEIYVVCTGKDFSEREQAELVELGIANNVIHLFTSEESLRNLYHFAIAFIYPSAYEGFGLPILEAFTSDCPVMLNNASCFPEVAEDAALYFDINEDGDLYEKFGAFYSAGRDVRNEMIRKGRDQAEKYSWDKSARLLRKVYDAL